MTDRFDVNKYVGVFLEEVDEHLESLEENLVQLEKDPEDTERVQAIFRSYHTIKGSSASMGFCRLSELAHLMENILDAVRSGSLAVTPSMVDILLRGVDAMRRLREEIPLLGAEPELDISHHVCALKNFLQEKETSPLPREESGEKEEDEDASGARETSIAGENTEKKDYLVRVMLAEDCSMKGVRAYLVINRLQEEGVEVTSTTPPLSDLETENFSREFTMEVRTSLLPAQLAEDIRKIAEIEDVDLSSLEEEEAFQPEQETEGEEEKPRFSHNLKKTVWVDMERLDALLNLVGELVIDRSRLEDSIQRLGEQDDFTRLQDSLDDTITHIGRVTNELQMEIMKARMLPLAEVFNRFPRMVRDLARTSGKEIDFTIEGEETELDRSLLEEITDPLIYLLRNAIDHGIEDKEERMRAGKDGRGHVLLKAYQEENSVVIMVKDDGKGIPLAKLRSRALEMGLVISEEPAKMSDREIMEVIFHPGFSTNDQVTDVSGRGVGMDIVKRNIERVNGQALVQSEEGRGTTFYLRLPLTLAIVRALMIRANDSMYALPLSDVVEIEKVRKRDTHWVNKVLTTLFRGDTLPLLELKDLIHSRKAEYTKEKEIPDVLYTIVVNTSRVKAGLVVDEILGEQEIVIKSLGSFIGDIRGLGGATILGDGRISLVLDVASLLWRFSQVGG